MDTLTTPGIPPNETSQTDVSNDNNCVDPSETSTCEQQSINSSKKKIIKPKTPLKETTQNEIIQRLSNNKSPLGIIASKELLANLNSSVKASLKKKDEIKQTEDKENQNEPLKEKTPNKTEVEPSKLNKNSKKNDEKPKTPKADVSEKFAKDNEVLTKSTSTKSIGKVSSFYQKCGLCNKAMNLAKEKTKLLSCTHRFHEECIAGKSKCFLCDSQEAYDSRPCEKSLKK